MVQLKPEIQSIFEESTLEFYLNGTRIKLHNPNPQWTLLDFIRSQDDLKGTKLGCGEGGCGACTVVLQTLNKFPDNRRIKHIAVNACLFPLLGSKLSSRTHRFLRADLLQSLGSMPSPSRVLGMRKVLIHYKNA